jgi:hypothetical protein
MRYLFRFIRTLTPRDTKKLTYTQSFSPVPASRYAHTVAMPSWMNFPEPFKWLATSLDEKRESLEKDQRELAKAHLSAARLMHYEGHNEKAIAFAKKVLEMDPTFKEAETFIEGIEFEETMGSGNVKNYTIE